MALNINRFGLIGTITSDQIIYESGKSFRRVGGILYQAAVLCGLGDEVFLYTNLGQKLQARAESLVSNWPTLHRDGMNLVPGQGNKVRLFYPEKGERQEILESVVPSLDPGHVLDDLPKFDMLIMAVNSGFDIELGHWRQIVERASCPIWLDFHSLVLAKKLNAPREYISLPEWKEWAKGVAYLQANRQEIACMLGHPQKLPADREVKRFADSAFDLGIRALLITLGDRGVLLATKEKSRIIKPPLKKAVVDTTGCGDVFCAASASRLAKAAPLFQAVSFGIELATNAVTVAGVKETYLLALSSAKI